MQHYQAFMLDAATLREDLAALEKQIQSNPNDINLIERYLTYARKVREIEYSENGFVTARASTPKNATSESRLLRQPLEDSPCC